MIRPQLWKDLREQGPLIHAISNLVTANDCANLLLAVGARPIMAQAPQEAAEITAQCAATVLNLGTPDDGKFAACRRAGREANRLGHPVILDPVGIGASSYRLEETRLLLETVHPDLIRANLGELQALLGQASAAQGVDSPNARQALASDCAGALAQQLGCVVLLTGEPDLVTDGTCAFSLTGGTPRLRQITGAGCMLSVLCGAMASVTDPLTAALHASWGWKVCAHRAQAQIGPQGGLGALHMALLDQAEGLAQSRSWEEVQVTSL